MIVYNTGENPVFITTRFEPDPNGGVAIPIEQFCVGPHQGIDLNLLGLKTGEECEEEGIELCGKYH